MASQLYRVIRNATLLLLGILVGASSLYFSLMWMVLRPYDVSIFLPKGNGTPIEMFFAHVAVPYLIPVYLFIFGLALAWMGLSLLYRATRSSN